MKSSQHALGSGSFAKIMAFLAVFWTGITGAFAKDAGGPVKVPHDWSLSGIAKILDENKEAFGDRITGIRFSSPEHMRVTLGWNNEAFTDAEQSCDMVYEEKSGWKIDSVIFVRKQPNSVIETPSKHKSPIQIQHDWMISKLADVLNRDPDIFGDRIIEILCEPDLLVITLGTNYAFIKNGLHQTRDLTHEPKAGWQISPENKLILRIVNIERKQPSNYELQHLLGLAAKWIVTTELTNPSGIARLIPAVPYYGGSVNGKADYNIFPGGSHLSFKSKHHDYLLLPPSGKLRAKHALFATPAKMKGKFVLSGYFLETENVPDAWRANNIPAEWTLSDNPVGNVFEFAATVVSATMYIDRENLGKDFSQLCRGELVSKPVKIRVFEE